MSCSSFQFDASPEDQPTELVSAVYVARDSVTPQEVKLALREHLLRTLMPHRVVVLGLDNQSRARTLQNLHDDEDLGMGTAVTIEGTDYSGVLEFVLLSKNGSLTPLDLEPSKTWPLELTHRGCLQLVLPKSSIRMERLSTPARSDSTSSSRAEGTKRSLFVSATCFPAEVRRHLLRARSCDLSLDLFIEASTSTVQASVRSDMNSLRKCTTCVKV